MTKVHQENIDLKALTDEDAILREYDEALAVKAQEKRVDEFKRKLEDGYPSQVFAFLYAIAVVSLSAGMIAVEALFLKFNGLYSGFFGGIWCGVIMAVTGVLIASGSKLLLPKSTVT